jgi:hypothetical protein
VAAGRANTFILVIDLYRAVKKFLKLDCPIQRSRAPYEKLFQNRIWDFYPSFNTHLLLDEVHWENRRQVFGAYRLMSARMKWRLQGSGHIRCYVVPLPWDLVFSQKNFNWHLILPFKL